MLSVRNSLGTSEENQNRSIWKVQNVVRSFSKMLVLYLWRGSKCRKQIYTYRYFPKLNIFNQKATKKVNVFNFCVKIRYLKKLKSWMINVIHSNNKLVGIFIHWFLMNLQIYELFLNSNIQDLLKTKTVVYLNWEQNLMPTDVRLFIVFIWLGMICYYMFHYRNCNRFDYRVPP